MDVSGEPGAWKTGSIIILLPSLFCPVSQGDCWTVRVLCAAPHPGAFPEPSQASSSLSVVSVAHKRPCSLLSLSFSGCSSDLSLLLYLTSLSLCLSCGFSSVSYNTFRRFACLLIVFNFSRDSDLWVGTSCPVESLCCWQQPHTHSGSWYCGQCLN